MRGSITESASGVRRKLYRWVERLTARFCNHTICVSDSAAVCEIEAILTSTGGMVPANGMSTESTSRSSLLTRAVQPGDVLCLDRSPPSRTTPVLW